MSLKNLLGTAAAVALFAPCALAQPTVTIDLVRDGGGIAQLSAAGNWQWVVSVTQDTIVDTVNGDANSYTGGVILADSLLVPGSAQTSGQNASLPLTNPAPLGTGVFTDSDLFDTFIPGDQIFDFETLGAGINGLAALGIQEDPDLEQIFVAIGSDTINNGPGGAAIPAFFFETVGPALGSLSASASLVLDSAGTLGAEVAQSTGATTSVITTVTGTQLSLSVTAQGGDADLNGTTDILDVVNFVLPNFDQSNPGGFTVGDFDGNGTTDILDVVNGVLPNFDQSSTPPIVASVIPEPASIALLACSAFVLSAGRRRR